MGAINVGKGWIVSLIVVGVLIVLILAVSIPLNRKYIVRENGKINYKKSPIFLRWNHFDTLTVFLAIYTIVCVQALNFFISFGHSVENVYVQFFTNQAQAWTIVTIAYLISRVTMTLRAIKERWGDEIE